MSTLKVTDSAGVSTEKEQAKAKRKLSPQRPHQHFEHVLNTKINLEFVPEENEDEIRNEDELQVLPMNNSSTVKADNGPNDIILEKELGTIIIDTELSNRYKNTRRNTSQSIDLRRGSGKSENAYHQERNSNIRESIGGGDARRPSRHLKRLSRALSQLTFNPQTFPEPAYELQGMEIQGCVHHIKNDRVNRQSESVISMTDNSSDSTYIRCDCCCMVIDLDDSFEPLQNKYL